MTAEAALELRIAGPDLERVLRLEAGAPECVLGRDTACSVQLPDPQRNISRRHLALWNEAGELHFEVLSSVNGVQMPFGEAPPGAHGVLRPGEVLLLADYQLSVERLGPAPLPEADPWAVFDQQDGSGTVALPRGMMTGAFAARTAAPGQGDDDPFGDWGFQTTFGPGGIAGGALNAGQGFVASDLQPFFRGLGLDPQAVGPLSPGELEAIGQLVRRAMFGLVELRKRADAHLPADVQAQRASTPLEQSVAPEAQLRYLFGGRAASSGHVAPERAVERLLGQVRDRLDASPAMARAAVEGVLREFEPDTLKMRLLGPGGKLFESARAWDAYSRDYREQAQQWPAWVQRLMDNYFTSTSGGTAGVAPPPNTPAK